jgi:hypothetical protein
VDPLAVTVPPGQATVAAELVDAAVEVPPPPVELVLLEVDDPHADRLRPATASGMAR